MSAHSLSEFAAHAVRDKSGLLDPARNPKAPTDTASTGRVPGSGRHAGDQMKGADGHAGADTKGL